MLLDLCHQQDFGLLLRVGCELDSWIMVGADGLGSKEDVRVFNLIVLAQFVWRVSSAAIPARRPQVVAPPDRMPRPYRVRRTRRDVRQRVSAPMGPMVYCRRNTAGARSPRSIRRPRDLSCMPAVARSRRSQPRVAEQIRS